MKNFSKVQIVRLLGITVLVTMIGTSLAACKQPSSEPSQFTVTFNAAGGIPGPAKQTISEGGKAIEPAAMTKNGYTFAGWYREAAFTNAWNFETDTVTSNLTLYAKWTSLQYTILFNPDGGTPEPVTQNIIYGDKVTEPAIMSKEGYTFDGWYKENTFNTKWNFSTGIIIGNTTLYAKWEPNTPGTFTVSFNANNGNSAPVSQNITSGGKVTEPAAMTRDGYTFAGWYREAAFTNEWDFETDTVTSNEIFYAKWIFSGSELIVDTWFDGEITTIANSDDWYSFPVTNGSTYYIWFNDSDVNNGKTLDIKVDAQYDNGTSIFTETDSAWNSAPYFSTTSTGMVLLRVSRYRNDKTGTYAITFSTSNIRPSTYTTTFNSNNGNGVIPTAQTVSPGSSIVLDDGSGLSRSGYVFNGWNTNADGTGENYTGGSSYTPKDNILLYAKWDVMASSGRFEYYWIDQHDSLVTTSGGEITMLLGETVTITTQGTGYVVNQWYLNGVNTGQNGNTYNFSSTALGKHTISIVLEKGGRFYNTNITITVKREVRIDMYDSQYDGWRDSGALGIKVNGKDITSARLRSDYFSSYSFYVVSGDVVEVFWTGYYNYYGDYHKENAFVMYYADNVPVPGFTPHGWSGDNTLLFRVYNSLSNANLNQSLGSFTVQ